MTHVKMHTFLSETKMTSGKNSTILDEIVHRFEDLDTNFKWGLPISNSFVRINKKYAVTCVRSYVPTGSIHS